VWLFTKIPIVEMAFAPESVTSAALRYVSTKGSKIYHFEECADAKRIKVSNRVESATPPKGKELHRGCPR
jgi:hypothetical protein